MQLFTNHPSSTRLSISRLFTRLLAGAATVSGLGLGLAQLGSIPSSAAATSPAVHVVGNHLVNSSGATVQLVGVNSSAHPWTVSFYLPAGVTVSQMWNASLVSQSAGLVKATAPSYTRSLAPGASIDVGWVEQGGQPLPASVTVRTS